MSLTSGQRLGAYEVVCPLGAGGMGEVYRALDTRLGREVALKILPADVTSEPGRLERFDREARAIAALNHPHIITIYSTEEADGIRFITMELVDGPTLCDLVVPPGMPVAQFLDIAIPLADALAAAHQKQITHRDLKPGNVMLSSDGRVKVLDFGLARIGGGSNADETVIVTQAPITHHGMIVGTMPYMSPEQVEGRALDARSDLFSLGIVFYELLTGERPFKGSSSASLMTAILRDQPPSLAKVRTDLPEPLHRLVERLLEKKADDRWQTARDVFNELTYVRSNDRSNLRSSDRSTVRSTERSIAVLPFTDLSEKKDQDWFCDGIAEEILNALAPLPGVRVAARASAFSFKGKSEDVRVIAEKLNVDNVLEGSVRRIGDRVRITTQLSDAKEGRQLWSERFDRDMKDIFDVQDEIARAVLERLRITLGVGDRLVQKPTSNIQAYELLLKGRAQLTRRGPAIVNAIAFFEQALAVDDRLAEAHAGLGTAYSLMSIYGMGPPREVMAKARAALERALALNPNEPDALATMANIAQAFEWDVAQGTRLTNRALEIDPAHVRALVEHALLTASAAPEPMPASIRERILERINRARDLDPLNAWVMAIEAFVLTVLGDPSAAVAAATRARTTDPGTFTAHGSLVSALAAAGRDDDARAAANAAFAIFGRPPSILAEVAALDAKRGDAASARLILDELTARSQTQYVSPAVRATVAASAGDASEALRLLTLAIDARDGFFTLYKLPAWRPLRALPECAARLYDIAFIKNGVSV